MTDVSGKPLLVNVDLFPNLLTGANTSNAQYKSIDDSLLAIMPELKSADPGLAQKLSGITSDLQLPLGVLFNNAWDGAWAQQQAAAAKTFEKKANGTGSSVSNVTCFLPPFGSVDAQVVAASGGQPQVLFLSFLLPGAFFHFNSGPLGAAWKLDFDLAIVLSTPAPPTPFNFTPIVNAQLSNAQMHADNFGADLDEFFDDLITDLGNFFTQSNQYVSDVDWDEQLAEQQTDGTQAVSAAAAKPLKALFALLNSATPDVAQAGFTECAFKVHNHQLVLTVTHPLDKGPKVEDSNNLPPPFFKIPPTLSADASQAVPGAQLHLVGTSFPLDTSTQLDLQWDNTSSGAPTSAQLQYGGHIYPVPKQPGFNGTYMYTVAGLTPGQSVTFEARCGDEVSWSKWSDPAVISTATTNLADIQLVPAPGNPSAQSFDLGTKPLSKTSPNFADLVTIPAGVPPGAYNLTASTAGQLIAETPIMIVSILAPTVDVIDPVTGIVGDAPIFGGLPFTLRGEAFPDGPVTVAINGSTVATPTAVNGKFTVPLKTPGNEWTVGIFPLTATSGAATATLDPPIDLEGAPQ